MFTLFMDTISNSRTRICARLDVDIFLDERIFAHSQNNICASRETCVPDQNALSVKQALFWRARAPSHYGNGALCVPTPTDIDVRGVVIVEQHVTGDVGVWESAQKKAARTATHFTGL
jgi:hypothetical protein